MRRASICLDKRCDRVQSLSRKAPADIIISAPLIAVAPLLSVPSFPVGFLFGLLSSIAPIKEAATIQLVPRHSAEYRTAGGMSFGPPSSIGTCKVQTLTRNGWTVAALFLSLQDKVFSRLAVTPRGNTDDFQAAACVPFIGESGGSLLAAIVGSDYRCCRIA